MIKKNNVVLELGKLEYHATQYSSIRGSSTVYKENAVYFISIVLELTKIEYLVTFFILGLSTNKHKHKILFILISTVLELGGLEYLVIFFFSRDYRQINRNIK